MTGRPAGRRYENRNTVKSPMRQTSNETKGQIETKGLELHRVPFFSFLKWFLISSVAAILAGSASAGFLYLLQQATQWREAHMAIIAFLPVCGLFVGLLYEHCGQSVEAGNHLLIDEIHDPKAVVPLRMAPLILIGTILTHLFGGSAGREGTAVQMGGALADQLSKPLRLSPADRRILLMAGISAGFSSVFGTPLAGTVFGLEVLAIGRLRYEAIFPCLIASVFAHEVTLAWGIHHSVYSIPVIPPFILSVFLAVGVASIFFGLTGALFAKATHRLTTLFKTWISYAPLRPVVGGVFVALAVFFLKTTKYIGLGLPTIADAFVGPLAPWDCVLKFLFTVVTLGAGFKGGEVTPLFFIGAALGNALSYLLPLPPAFLAGIGFVAVFAGAANTPLAGTFMAMELFGPGMGIYAAIGCVISYVFSGHAGIYPTQKKEHVKI